MRPEKPRREGRKRAVKRGAAQLFANPRRVAELAGETEKELARPEGARRGAVEPERRFQRAAGACLA
jgi:hypothetical protein